MKCGRLRRWMNPLGVILMRSGVRRPLGVLAVVREHLVLDEPVDAVAHPPPWSTLYPTPHRGFFHDQGSRGLPCRYATVGSDAFTEPGTPERGNPGRQSPLTPRLAAILRLPAAGFVQRLVAINRNSWSQSSSAHTQTPAHRLPCDDFDTACLSNYAVSLMLPLLPIVIKQVFVRHYFFIQISDIVDKFFDFRYVKLM